MNSWEWIFRQSKVNDGGYDGERLAVQNWDWPRDTWLQKRLRYIRRENVNKALRPPLISTGAMELNETMTVV